MGSFDRTLRRTLWLPPTVTAGLVWLAYGVGNHDEAGSRAGAEPVLAGIALATPFALVGLVQVAAALLAILAVTEGQQWACVVTSSLGGALLVVVVTTLDGSPGVHHEMAVAAATLAPLIPAWIAITSPRRVGRPVSP